MKKNYLSSYYNILFGLFFLFFLCLFISSCQKDDINQENSPFDNDNHISKNEAKLIASKIKFKVTNAQSSKNKELENKKVKEISSVPNEEGDIVYYIINYEKKGFLILAADNRIEPILAFSEDNNFPLDNEEYPNGLVEWLVDTKNFVDEVRKSSNLKHNIGKQMSWTTQSIQNIITPHDGSEIRNFNKAVDDPPGEDPCEDQHELTSPLLTTKWGQGNGYNNFVPLLNCNSSNGRAPTGCVATAMAQVMRYHEFPNNYTWANMPDDYGTTATATLMADIGNSVNMNYACDGSGTGMDEISPSFTGDFGYLSATKANFNRDIVTQQLRLDQPVILSGGRKDGWWIFGVFADGHAWVCDGFIRSVYCSGNTYLMLHMNWGWGDYQSGRELNGYYAFNNWDPGDHTFNYKREMIYNIRP